MSFVSAILERPSIYRTWQGPFVKKKIAPVLRNNQMQHVRRVLDVGCGPGTNTSHFAAQDYLGLDVNPRYVEDARRRYGREFQVADVAKYRLTNSAGFDFILLNSLLHHLDQASTRRLLTHLCTLLTPDGHVHILDLILPENPSIARLLARWDRGGFPRPLADWERLLASVFRPVVIERYAVSFGGVVLWNMFYFKGQSK